MCAWPWYLQREGGCTVPTSDLKTYLAAEFVGNAKTSVAQQRPHLEKRPRLETPQEQGILKTRAGSGAYEPRVHESVELIVLRMNQEFMEIGRQYYFRRLIEPFGKFGTILNVESDVKMGVVDIDSDSDSDQNLGSLWWLGEGAGS